MGLEEGKTSLDTGPCDRVLFIFFKKSVCFLGGYLKNPCVLSMLFVKSVPYGVLLWAEQQMGRQGYYVSRTVRRLRRFKGVASVTP